MSFDAQDPWNSYMGVGFILITAFFKIKKNDGLIVLIKPTTFHTPRTYAKFGTHAWKS